MTGRPRILIAAPKSGSGKTLLTCAAIQAFINRGLKVSAFKTGPDYIDPMFHREVLKVPSTNLDLFFTDEETTRDIFRRNAGEDISVIEGVMGLFDGLGGLSEEGSAYHLACTLKTPVLLILDTRGMSRSILAEIAGFLSMDHDHLIRGVICNRLSPMLYQPLKELVQEQLHIPVVGYFPNDPDTKLESRYLGLKLPGEIENIHQTLNHSAQILEKCVDLDLLMKIAREAPELNMPAGSDTDALSETKTSARMCSNVPESETSVGTLCSGTESLGRTTEKKNLIPVRIAVARDDAFCFYYEENLQVLRECGLQTVEFSPLKDRQLPENVCGMLLGGGYPENYAGQLSENEPMLRSIRQAIASGMPSLAECGGFMYLHDYIQTEDGEQHRMAGVVPGGCRYTGKLVRFGYVTLTEHTPCFMEPGESIRAHEFHYYDSDDSGSSCRAVKPTGKRSWDCEMAGEDHFWGYPHLYYRSDIRFVWHFADMCRKYAAER